MRSHSAVVSPEDQGVRLDAFLSRLCGVTRSRAQGLIQSGNARVNGAPPSKAGYALRAGDAVEANIPEPAPIAAAAQAMPLAVLYQDRHIAVVVKPRGVVTHPSAGHADGTLVNALLAACGDLSGIGGALRPGIVHRLDKDTTGLLVIAKDDAAHLALSEQIKARTAGREYLALVYGNPREDEGTVDRPIGRHPAERKKMAIVPGGRAAVTRYRVEQRLDGCALLRLKLETGRTHQIRVHMRSLGHPVLGDPVYGVKGDKTPVLMLHAFRLSVRHPVTGEAMCFTAPPPEDFMRVLSKRGGATQLY